MAFLSSTRYIEVFYIRDTNESAVLFEYLSEQLFRQFLQMFTNIFLILINCRFTIILILKKIQKLTLIKIIEYKNFLGYNTFVIGCYRT